MILRHCTGASLGATLATLALSAAAQAPALLPATSAASSAAWRRDASTSQLIVKYRDESAESHARSPRPLRADRLAALQDGVAHRGIRLSALRVTGLGSHVLRMDRRMSVDEAAAIGRELMGSDPRVEYAEPDRPVRPLFVPTDPDYPSQWWLEDINVAPAWSVSTGEGVVVAVIDTGEMRHPDLVHNLLPGRDFVSANSGDGTTWDADPTQPSSRGACPTISHGTHMAGLIAADSNGQDMVGVAPGAWVQHVRALPVCALALESDVASAVVWASGGAIPWVPMNPTPARVLNLSLGLEGGCSSTMRAAIDGAVQRGAIPVAAAGNSGDGAAVESPANCPGVIAVTAQDAYGSYATVGPEVDISAPGGDGNEYGNRYVWSTMGDYLSWDPPTFRYFMGAGAGTSVSAALVSGALAVIWSARLTAPAIDVVDSLIFGAKAPANWSYPYPRVDVDAAMRRLLAKGPYEVEPNGSATTANLGPVSRAPNDVTVLNGFMNATSDADWYKVVVPAGKTILPSMTPNASSNYDLQVLDSNLAVVATSRNGTGSTDSKPVTNTSSVSRTYYARVYYVSGGIGYADGRYKFSFVALD